jgi:hypothetical protein
VAFTLKGPSLLSTDLVQHFGPLRPLALRPFRLYVCPKEYIYLSEDIASYLFPKNVIKRSLLHVKTSCSSHVCLLITLDPYARGLSDQQHAAFIYQARTWDLWCQQTGAIADTIGNRSRSYKVPGGTFRFRRVTVKREYAS